MPAIGDFSQPDEAARRQDEVEGAVVADELAPLLPMFQPPEASPSVFNTSVRPALPEDMPDR
jgi:hypothetical protein